MFDVAFDKGTLDALFCGADAPQKVGMTLTEIHRVLKPRGLFFEITYGKPESRVAIFEGYELDWILHDPVPIRNVERGGWHWIYIFEKHGEVGRGEVHDDAVDTGEAPSDQLQDEAPDGVDEIGDADAP
jgi:hypothetical protein